ncbi:C5-sterol desaturase [Suillus subluteus]|nr:C5-sterol desaturase [Suillus subluteus]
MDLVLHLADDYLLDKVWARLLPLNNHASYASSANFTSITYLEQSAWPRDYIPRQIISLSVITLIGIHCLYFLFAWLSYKFIFNHEMMRHPRFLQNQVKQEIQCSVRAFPTMTLLTLPWFQAEVMGYSKLYDNVEEYGWAYIALSVPFFLLFTDYGIYWYRPPLPLMLSTPWTAILQSVPYHLFIFIFPLHRWLYLGLFVFVNFWSILIHDSDMVTGHALEKVINGPAHHTLHHLYFTVNYGQYFTWADRVYGSYRQPESSLDPMLEIKKQS